MTPYILFALDCMLTPLALLMAGGGAAAFGVAVNRRLGSRRAWGVVLRLEEEPVEGTDPPKLNHFAVVRYEVGGAEHEFRESAGDDGPRYREGQAVRVRYRPSEPGKGWLADWRAFWLPPLMACLFGAGLLSVKWYAFGWQYR